MSATAIAERELVTGFITRLMSRPSNTEVTQPADLDTLIRRSENTWAGHAVTPLSALNVGPVLACVRLISEDIAKLPFPVYRREGDGGRERARDTAYWGLIHDRPNPWQSSQQFREMLTAHALLRGNGFADPVMRGGRVTALLPLQPDQVRIEIADDGTPLYFVRPLRGGAEEMRTRREIFHLPGFTIDGVNGVSVVRQARQTIAHAMATESHGAKFFGNGAHPGAVLKHPGNLSKGAQERLKDDVKEAAGGDNAGDFLILEEGLDWKQTTLSNEDSQFLQTRQFEVTEIARWFRVPPHKISDLSRATFSNIEHQALEYVTDTLMPWAQRWENAVNHTVIREDGLFAELLFDALLRGDTQSRHQAYRIATGRPWMAPNEVRERENLQLKEGLDEVSTPLNVTTEPDGTANREVLDE